MADKTVIILRNDPAKQRKQVIKEWLKRIKNGEMKHNA